MAVDRVRLAHQLGVRAALHHPARVHHDHLVGAPRRWTAGARSPPWSGPGSPCPARAAAAPRSPGRPRWSPRPAPADRGRPRTPGPARPAAAPPREAPRRARRPGCPGRAGRPATQSARPSSANAAASSASVSSGRANRTFSATVASNRNPSCGTITTRARSDANRTSVSGTPASSTSPAVGSISRVSSLAKVVLPLPVSPTTATRVRAGDGSPHRSAPPGRPGRRTRRRRSRTSTGPGGSVPARRPGRRRPARVSSTSSTRRQPATAFCASLSTSVAICTGWMNSATRNRNAVSCTDAQRRRRRRAEPRTTTTAASGQPGGQLAAGEADHAGPLRPLLRRAGGLRSPCPAGAAVRPATPYARITSAPTTLSATAPSIAPTRRRTSP